jgi:hypothetical protein
VGGELFHRVLELVGTFRIEDEVVQRGLDTDDQIVAAGIVACQVLGGGSGLVGGRRQPTRADSFQGMHDTRDEPERAGQDLLGLGRVGELGVAGDLLLQPALDPIVAGLVDGGADSAAAGRYCPVAAALKTVRRWMATGSSQAAL